MNEENSWSMWKVPYKYIRHYFFLMVGILFILPVLTGLRYTLTGYVINYLFADALFYRWCSQKLEDDEAEARRKHFLGE
jgi:hypothetical protein